MTFTEVRLLAADMCWLVHMQAGVQTNQSGLVVAGGRVLQQGGERVPRARLPQGRCRGAVHGQPARVRVPVAGAGQAGCRRAPHQLQPEAQLAAALGHGGGLAGPHLLQRPSGR